MALENTTATSSGVFGAIKGVLKLFADVNKADSVTENGNPQPIDPYESSYSEVEITQLVAQWKRTYATYDTDVEPSQRLSFEYWIGKQRMDESEQLQGNSPLVDNKIFESVETFIPIATRANPDPLVEADPSDDGQALAKAVKEALIKEADKQKFRKKLKRMLRDWIIYRIGVLKVSYSTTLNKIETDPINPRRMIFDKDGHIDESGNFIGEYLGEKKQATAEKLVELFPRKSAEIKAKAQDKMATKLEYIEWWYHGTDVFYTMESTVLGKYKNPHWNYTQGEVEGKNHLDKPCAPYVFLSIFSTGLQPHDETSLILQNIGIQDMINRRWRQIDRNVEGMNNGIIVSSVFTSEQASQAASALRRGMAIRIPSAVDGSVGDHVQRIAAPELPSQVYDTMRDGRDELSNIFGTSGSTPQGVDSQDTVRGKILVNQLDSSRIGGGITEYLEQAADTTYNWWVQMMFVHWTDEQYIMSAGSVDGGELITLKNIDFLLTKTLDITVKEGSLIPKDPLTQRNEAIDLWSAGAIDPITFFKRLDASDPVGEATMLLTWQLVQKGVLPPQAYIPSFGQQNGMTGALPPAPGVGGPAVNPIGPATPSTQAPAPTSPPAVQSEASQLIKSVPA